MNKAEIIARITNKYFRVGNLRPAADPNPPRDKNNNIKLDGQGNPLPSDYAIRKAAFGYDFYAINVTELITSNDGDDITKTGNVFFQVFDEGEATERAAFEDRLLPDFLKLPNDNTFKDAVVAWYSVNKSTDIVCFQVLEVDRDAQFAIVRVFEEEPGGLNGPVTEKRVFIYKEEGVIAAVPFTGM